MVDAITVYVIPSDAKEIDVVLDYINDLIRMPNVSGDATVVEVFVNLTSYYKNVVRVNLEAIID